MDGEKAVPGQGMLFWQVHPIPENHCTFHPAYLLRTPEAKRDAWRDLLLVHKKLAAPRPKD